MENTIQEPCQYLASTLRALRNERGWSLDRAAQETGVSKAMLGQIERGESSPTIATRQRLPHLAVELSLPRPSGNNRGRRLPFGQCPARPTGERRHARCPVVPL